MRSGDDEPGRAGRDVDAPQRQAEAVRNRIRKRGLSNAWRSAQQDRRHGERLSQRQTGQRTPHLDEIDDGAEVRVVPPKRLKFPAIGRRGQRANDTKRFGPFEFQKHEVFARAASRAFALRQSVGIEERTVGLLSFL